MRTSPPSLDRFRGQELTLEELADAAGRLLHRLEVRADDGRVATRVDARGIRYYQTLGLLDKPLRYDGRRAVYGYRHLLQLLAVRKLQQEGHPLQVIQQALAGRSGDTLERALANLADAQAAGQPPEPMTEVRLTPGRALEAEGDTEAGIVRSDTAAAVSRRRLVAAHVAPGVTVTVDPAVVADPDEVIASIEHALARLKA